MENGSSIHLDRVRSQFQSLQSIVERAYENIKNAQKNGFPYAGLNDAERTFAAILSAQARDLAGAACKQFGFELKKGVELDAQLVENFFKESAAFTGTDACSMETARLHAVDALIKTARDLLARAERVLEREETMTGERLAHGALWYK